MEYISTSVTKFLVAVRQRKFYVRRLIAESMYLKFLYRNSWLKYAFDDFVAEIPCRRPALCNFVDEIPCCKLAKGLLGNKIACCSLQEAILLPKFLFAACRKRFCCLNSCLQVGFYEFCCQDFALHSCSE